jgi:hypothetical protein
LKNGRKEEPICHFPGFKHAPNNIQTFSSDSTLFLGMKQQQEEERIKRKKREKKKKKESTCDLIAKQVRMNS